MTTSVAVGGPLVRRVASERRILVIASFGAFLAFLDATIVNVAFPSIEATWPHASISSLSWILTSYNIVFAALLVASGRIADLIGRRRAFRVGVVVFTLGSAACALSWSVGALIAFRCVQAVGAAVLVPASLAVVVEASDAEHRAHAVSLWGASAAVAAGLGPPIGGALVEISDWRLTFLVNVPLGAVAFAVARSGLVESRAPGRRVWPDVLGTGLLGLALGALTLGIVEGSPWGWASPLVLGSFALALAAAAGVVVSSLRHPSPVFDPALLRIRSFSVSNAVTVVAGMGFYAYLLTHILWLRFVWGYSILDAGLAVAPGAFVAAGVAGPLGRIADTRGHRFVAVPGALLWAASFAWYITQVGTTPHFLTEWLPGQIISGIGVGATLPVLGSAGLAAVPGGRYATASAALSSSRQLGGALGVAILVVLVGTPGSRDISGVLKHGWLFSALCFLVVAAGSAFIAVIPRIDEDVATGPAAVELGGSLVALAPIAALNRPVGSRDGRATTDAGALAGVALLADLPAEARDRLTARARAVPLRAGEWLFHQGDAADALYVVRTGRLEVLVDGVRVSELGPGAVLGELGLLTGAPRAGSVRARRDSELLRVAKRTFDTVLASDPRAARRIARGLALQIQRTRPAATAPAPPSVIVVCALGRLAPAVAVADVIVEEMARFLDVVAPGKIDPDGLERAEREHDRVVLVVRGTDDEEWREFCLRQADRVVLVGEDTTPDPRASGPRGAHLVVPGDRLGSDDVAAWVEALAPVQIHSLGARPVTWAHSLRPLARRLGGRSIGLALAGGGARSFAHIGVIEELLTAGVEIDRVSGCSVGAYVAALFACGLDPDGIDARCYEDFVAHNPFADYTVPRVALARGLRGRAMLTRTFGDLRFEQLPREFVCVSTDLFTRDLVVHRNGLLRDALGASMSLPGLFPPYRADGRLLIDGGVLDNLPVEPLCEKDEGPVIAVNIGASTSPRAATGPDGPRTPMLGDTLMRVLIMSSSNALERARTQAAIMVTPDTRGVGLLEFHQIDRMRAAGREAARAALDNLGSLVSPHA